MSTSILKFFCQFQWDFSDTKLSRFPDKNNTSEDRITIWCMLTLFIVGRLFYVGTRSHPSHISVTIYRRYEVIWYVLIVIHRWCTHWYGAGYNVTVLFIMAVCHSTRRQINNLKQQTTENSSHQLVLCSCFHCCFIYYIIITIYLMAFINFHVSVHVDRCFSFLWLARSSNWDRAIKIDY